jgi:Ca2+/Na+ antiporter
MNAQSTFITVASVFFSICFIVIMLALLFRKRSIVIIGSQVSMFLLSLLLVIFLFLNTNGSPGLIVITAFVFVFLFAFLIWSTVTYYKQSHESPRRVNETCNILLVPIFGLMFLWVYVYNSDEKALEMNHNSMLFYHSLNNNSNNNLTKQNSITQQDPNGLYSLDYFTAIVIFILCILIMMVSLNYTNFNFFARF